MEKKQEIWSCLCSRLQLVTGLVAAEGVKNVAALGFKCEDSHSEQEEHFDFASV